jgi:glutamate-1-semialdehyde 2,1-aminomutase
LVDAASLAAVNDLGERLRAGLDARFASSPLDFCASGWGSILNVHPVAGPVRSPDDLAAADPRWRELFFHDLLADGFYLAPRGYMALSMDVSADDTGRFLDAVERFCDRRRGLA